MCYLLLVNYGPPLWFSRVYSLPLYLLVHFCGLAQPIERETRRWIECSGWPEMLSEPFRNQFAVLATRLPEFRSLLLYRLRHLPFFVRLPLRLLWAGRRTLYFAAEDIGPGLFIQHGFATGIDAERIGADCWINQQVTIGHTSKGKPTIGDRVIIGAAAIVVGPITIGDDAVIGANATVVTDVPAGAVYAAPRAVEISRPPAKVKQDRDTA